MAAVVVAAGVLAWRLFGPVPDPSLDGQPLSHWIGILEHADGQLYIDRAEFDRAREVLAKLREEDVDAVPRLVSVLKERSKGVAASHAMYGLARIGRGAEAAAPVLERLAREGDLPYSARAAYTLWKVTGDRQRGIPRLIELLDPEHGIEEVSQLLGRIGREARAAVPALLPLVQHDDVHARRNAMRCLSEIGYDSRDVVRAILLRVVMEDEDLPFLTARSSVSTISATEEGRRLVAEAMRDDDPRVRLGAATARAGHQVEVLPCLLELMGHEDLHERLALCLASIGENAYKCRYVNRELVRALDREKDGETRARILTLLLFIPPYPESERAFAIRLLRDDAAPLPFRIQAAYLPANEERGDAESLKALREALASAHPELRVAAAAALEALGEGR